MDSAAPATDISTVNRVVMFLGAATLLGLAGIIGLAALSKPVPVLLGSLTSAAGASLGTLLASPRGIDPARVHSEGYQAAVADVQSLDPAAAPLLPSGAVVGQEWPPEPAAPPYQPQHAVAAYLPPPAPPG